MGLACPDAGLIDRYIKLGFVEIKLVRTGDRCYSFPLLSLVVNPWFVVCHWAEILSVGVFG